MPTYIGIRSTPLPQESKELRRQWSIAIGEGVFLTIRQVTSPVPISSAEAIERLSKVIFGASRAQMDFVTNAAVYVGPMEQYFSKFDIESNTLVRWHGDRYVPCYIF